MVTQFNHTILLCHLYDDYIKVRYSPLSVLSLEWMGPSTTSLSSQEGRSDGDALSYSKPSQSDNGSGVHDTADKLLNIYNSSQDSNSDSTTYSYDTTSQTDNDSGANDTPDELSNVDNSSQDSSGDIKTYSYDKLAKLIMVVELMAQLMSCPVLTIVTISQECSN